MRYAVLFCALATGIAACVSAGAATRTVSVDMLGIARDTGSLKVYDGRETVFLRLDPAAQVLRGQVGGESRPAKPGDLAPGDRLDIDLDNDGRAISIRSVFGIVKGVLADADSSLLTLSDGRTVPMNRDAIIVAADRTTLSADRLKPGAQVTCRINPVTGEAWTVLVGSKAAARAQSSHSPPKISAVTYSAPTPVRAGSIITVDLSGSPSGRAWFHIKGLVQADMKEISPGSYRAEYSVPPGKAVIRAPLVGYLAVGTAKAPPVQAGRLITVEVTASPAKNAVVKVKPSPGSTSTGAPPSVAEPQSRRTAPSMVEAVPAVGPSKPGAPTETGRIIITCPVNGARIKRAILVRGAADPHAKVRVTVTYNNGRNGVLKLAGQAASQDVAAGKNGEFRLGPIPLEGPLATDGLKFTIKTYYPDRSDHATATLTVIGDRK